MMNIIENIWEKDHKICKIFFYYEKGCDHPFVKISGYNPFPFFSDSKNPFSKSRLETTRTVFDKWMTEQGWEKILRTTDVFGFVSIK